MLHIITKILLLASVTAYQTPRDFKKSLNSNAAVYVDQNKIGMQVDSSSPCSTWNHDCHSCVMAGCSPVKGQKICALPGMAGSTREHETPTFD